MSRDFNEAYVYSLLRDHPALEGKPQAIAALMGTIYDETGVTEDQAFEHTTAQKGNRGYGLFQFDWKDQKNKSGGMRGAYNNWLEDNDIDDSTESQINFALDSMLGEKPYYDIGAGHRSKLRESFAGGDTADILDNVTKRFERAGKPHQKRVDYALGFKPENIHNVPYAAAKDFVVEPALNWFSDVKDTLTEPEMYVTQSGDNVHAIAKSYGMSVDELQALNPDQNILGNVIFAGKPMKVGGNWFEKLF